MGSITTVSIYQCSAILPSVSVSLSEGNQYFNKFVTQFNESLSLSVSFPSVILLSPLFPLVPYRCLIITLSNSLYFRLPSPTGKRYDKHGNVSQWWSEEMAEQFTERAACFVEQYSQYPIEMVGKNVSVVCVCPVLRDGNTDMTPPSWKFIVFKFTVAHILLLPLFLPDVYLISNMSFVYFLPSKSSNYANIPVPFIPVISYLPTSFPVNNLLSPFSTYYLPPVSLTFMSIRHGRKCNFVVYRTVSSKRLLIVSNHLLQWS